MSTPTPVVVKPKTSVVSTVLSVLKKTVIGFIVVTLLFVVYGLAKRAFIKFYPSKGPAVPEVQKEFALEDEVSFNPVLGSVNTVVSDKTIDALLSGKLGPAVVMFYADWCAHCRNMEHAYNEAAAKSHVPFVRISGVHAPVSSAKYGVNGYPTIFGTNILGPLPHRFNNARTSDNFLDFANQISPKIVKDVPEIIEAPTEPIVAPVVATVVAPVVAPSVDELKTEVLITPVIPNVEKVEVQVAEKV
jgi:thiol-disulfide isomerase/thioredoxin